MVLAREQTYESCSVGLCVCVSLLARMHVFVCVDESHHFDLFHGNLCQLLSPFFFYPYFIIASLFLITWGLSCKCVCVCVCVCLCVCVICEMNACDGMERFCMGQWHAHLVSPWSDLIFPSVRRIIQHHEHSCR